MGSYDNISKLFWEVEYELFSKVRLRAKFPRVSQDVLTRAKRFWWKKKKKPANADTGKRTRVNTRVTEFARLRLNGLYR